jgi:hypothetical protein
VTRMDTALGTAFLPRACSPVVAAWGVCPGSPQLFPDPSALTSRRPLPVTGTARRGFVNMSALGVLGKESLRATESVGA